MKDVLLQAGLPANLDAERFVLGSILLDDATFDMVVDVLQADDFSLEKHRRILRRMHDLRIRGERIDRVTVANELDRHNELESCDGLSYPVSLDDGLPRIVNLDSYVRIVQEKATLRRAIFAAQNLIDRCVLEQDGSREILAGAESALAILAETQRPHGEWLTPGDVIETCGGLDALMAPSRGGSGVQTPWPRLTAALCGLQVGDLILVAGRPSMGKSIIAMQMAHHAATCGHGAAFISLEMSKESLILRLIAAVARVDAQRLRSGKLNSEERKRVSGAASEIKDLYLWIDDTRARTVPAVTVALRKLAARQKVELLFIDHLQLMKCIGRIESRHQELSEISHALKHLARDRKLTVVLLSQLNRECEREKRRPQLADLKESGSLEEDADVVLFVHRPEQFDRQDKGLRGVAEFILGKQRNGPTGKLNMVFRHEFQRFDEAAMEAGDDAPSD